MNYKDIRWKQRFENFEKSFLLLERTMQIVNPSEAEKGGIIQFHETTLELSWNLMKDYLESIGYITKNPRETIKQSFQSEIITEGEQWLQALEDRNLTSHTYDEEMANKVVDKIRNSYFKLLKQLYIFFKNEAKQ